MDMLEVAQPHTPVYWKSEILFVVNYTNHILNMQNNELKMNYLNPNCFEKTKERGQFFLFFFHKC